MTKFSREDYRKARREFGISVSRIVRLSASIAGSNSDHGRQYWSSILAAKLALNAMTLDKIIPRKPTKQSKELYDLSSIASLLRVLIENYILLIWLCVQPQNEDVWEFRIAALTLADNRARFRIFGELDKANSAADYEKAQSEIREHLKRTKVFKRLSQGKQKELLKGEKSPFIQDEVMDHFDWDSQDFRVFYRYLSSFVHTNTVSFFRVERSGRSTGEFNEYEASVITGLMVFANDTLARAEADLSRLHGVRAS